MKNWKSSPSSEKKPVLSFYNVGWARFFAGLRFYTYFIKQLNIPAEFPFAA